ncbi:MAG: hypothetical protein VB912_04995 [Pirellulaceae bacterium]
MNLRNATRRHAACLLSMVLTGCLASQVSVGQTPYPMVMSLEPVAAQQGQSSEHTVRSRYNMFGAYRVLVSGTGVTGEVVPPEPPPEKKEETKKEEKPAEEKEEKKEEKPANIERLKVRFTVTADALPGVRDFRIATPQGVSTVGQLVIAPDTVVRESGNNDKLEDANEVPVPATVCGAFEKGEDIDYYKFKAEAGMAISFHVRCMRLQDRIHDLQNHADPMITLRNTSGTTLAAVDNYFAADPWLTYQFKEAGEYYLEMRDVRFNGNEYWQYSLEISNRPFISNVYPLGVKRGEEVDFRLVGFGIEEQQQAKMAIAAEGPLGLQWVQLMLGETLSNPAPVVVSDLPLLAETNDPNNETATAQPISIPIGVNGRIERETDIDCYRFDAKKGERYTIEVVARRHQSMLDSHIRIMNAEGKEQTLNDDMKIGKHTFADSQVENWTVPADGQYVIEVRDLHLRGGPEHVYLLKVSPSKEDFRIFADTDKTQLTPGTGGVVFVRIERRNGFEGEVQLHVEGLPKGVQAHCGKILAGKGVDGSIIFQAAADAPMDISNLTIRGTSEIKEGEQVRQLDRRAVVYQETYQPGGGRGHWTVDEHALSVGTVNDIRSLKVSTQEITAKPGESVKIDVEIERVEGFDKNVSLDVLFKHLSSTYGNSLPEGVTLDDKNSKILLTGKESKGHITLKVADTAPPAQQQLFPVMAHVSINFVMKATYAVPLKITVLAKEKEEETKTEEKK